jgi:Kef-type K+ transport system membrane component KefB
MLIAPLAVCAAIRHIGEGLVAPDPPADVEFPARPVTLNKNVVFHVLATMTAVITLGYLFGRICIAVHQPPVVGEVIAGIVLGPTLLGAFWPEAMHTLIPVDSEGRRDQQVVAALTAIAQIGVCLYMFIVGLELNTSKLQQQAHATIAISHASIVLPFVLGALLALWLYPLVSNNSVSFTSFALFMGAAMAVTAFPVLARILGDLKLDKSDLGVTALGCAAADDFTAWCLLALIVGVAQANVSDAFVVCASAIGFIAFMFVVIRPIIHTISNRLDAMTGPLPSYVFPGTLAAVLLSSMITEMIGVHAVIGAFLLGAVTPHDGRLSREFTSKIQDIVTVLLLPAFFALTGMRTSLETITETWEWLACLVIILVATAGKFGGTFIAARMTGYSWRPAAALGMLMNTRGLMGLIVLNIGLRMGVISPKLFAMMVLMAVATTIATAPTVRWLLHVPQSTASPEI